MKRKIVSILLLVIMVFSLAACGSDSDSKDSDNDASKGGNDVIEDETKDETGEDTVIEIWTNDRHDLEYVESMIDKYNETNEDGIFIKQTVITEDYPNMLSLAYSGGTAPDIASATPLSLNNFADTGILIPLNDYIDSDETLQMVNEPYVHSYEGKNLRDGKLYSVYSGMRSGVRVQYNEDLLSEAGYTEIPTKLDDYINMAKDVKEKTGVYGIGFTSSSPFERLLEMSAQVSGIFYYDYVNGKYDFTGYKPILELGRRFIEEDIAYPDQQGVDNMRALFTEGKFALWSNASQEAAVFTEQLPITDFEWGVAEVPSLTGEIEGALQTTLTKSYGIVSKSEHKDEAWKVIQFFQSEEFLKGYFENGYCLPLTSYMYDVVDMEKTGRLADFAKVEYESVYPEPPIINLTGDDYRTVLWNAVMGYVDIDEAIEDLNTRYNEALEADISSGTTQRIVIPDYDPLNPNEGTIQYLDN